MASSHNIENHTKFEKLKVKFLISSVISDDFLTPHDVKYQLKDLTTTKLGVWSQVPPANIITISFRTMENYHQIKHGFEYVPLVIMSQR